MLDVSILFSCFQKYLPQQAAQHLNHLQHRHLVNVCSACSIAMYHALFMSQPTPGQALRLVVRHKVSITLALPVSDEAKVRQIPGVKEISVWNWFGGSYKDARDQRNFFARLGVEPKAFMTIRTDMKMPEDQRKAFLTNRTGCIISKDLSEKLALKLNDRVVLVGDIYPYDARHESGWHFRRP